MTANRVARRYPPQRWRANRRRDRRADRAPDSSCASIPTTGWRVARPLPDHVIPDRPRPGQEVTAGHRSARPGITARRHRTATLTSPHDPRGWTALEGAAADGHRSHDDDPRAEYQDAGLRCACCLPGRGLLRSLQRVEVIT